MCTIKNKNGFTIIEVLIAVILTGIIVSGGFHFYTSMNQQATAQMDISNVQNIVRSSLEDIASTIRQAGYKLQSHDPYLINGDSLLIFFSVYNSVDTVTYYLSENPEQDHEEDEISSDNSYCLMKCCSYGTNSIYADNIVSIKFDSLKANIIQITMTAQSERADDTYKLHNGYRRWTLSETVCLRNI